jgi:hypothetical protein
MNHSMTMLAAQFGEDWTAYLPAVTLAYNSSVTESTGYTPFALMYGREPQLMGDVHMVLGDGADAPASTDSFYVALGKRLQRAYAFVRKQQERMASNNRARRALSSKKLVFKLDDLVLY